MIINCVDTSDPAGWIASCNLDSPISISGKDTAGMVDLVLKRAGSKKISRLNIMDHGTPHSIQIGNERITSGAFASTHPMLKSKVQKELERLKGHFTPNGSVFLMQCNSGQDQSLIRGFAKAVGVNVYATPYKYQGLLHTTSRSYWTLITLEKNEATDPLTSEPPYVCATPGGTVTTLTELP